MNKNIKIKRLKKPVSPSSETPKSTPMVLPPAHIDIFGETVSYSNEESGYLCDLGINPTLNPDEASSAVSLIVWLKEERNNLKMAVNQSIKDDIEAGQEPFELPEGKLFRVTSSGKLTRHFIRWFTNKCKPDAAGIRDYSFEAIKRGDYLEHRLSGNHQTLNYKGGNKGRNREHLGAISAYVRSRLKSDLSLSTATLWSDILDCPSDIEDEVVLMKAIPTNNPEFLLIQANETTKEKKVTFHTVQRIATKVRKEFDL